MTALYILIVLQALDVLTTLVALKNPKLVEANPVLAKLFEKFGPAPVLLTVKGSFIALLWWATPLIIDGGYESALWALCAFYVWVVWNNAKLIRKT